MTCLQISTVTPLYLSGELDAPGTRQFEAHLLHCPSCATAIEQQKSLDRRLREAILEEDVKTARVEARVRLAIREKSTARRGWAVLISKMKWRSAAALCGVAVLALLGYIEYLRLNPAAALSSAAHDHRLEVLQQASRPWQSDPALIQQLLADHNLGGISVAGLAPPGYRLNRGKICLIGGRLMLHLVFQGGAQPVSVFLSLPSRAEAHSISPDQVREAPVQTANYGPDHVAYFRSHRLLTIVVTDQSAGAAILFARGVSNRL
jgi:anti-sigma factor RsiW